MGQSRMVGGRPSCGVAERDERPAEYLKGVG